MRYRLAFVLAVAGLTALASAPAAFAADWRDTGICDVRTTDFPTIQSAIDQPLCLTVRLPATREDLPFQEQITIPRSVSIVGQSFQQGIETFVTRLHPPADMVGPYLINVTGARTRVKLRHVVIEGPGTGDWLIGLGAGRDTRLTVRDCVFRNMRPPTLDGRWGFMAIHVGGPLQPKAKVGISGHSITGCRFDGYQNAAILVEGAGTTANIASNLISGAAQMDAVKVRPAGTASPVGVLLFDGASVTVHRNDLIYNATVDGLGAGIFIHDGAEGSVISYNNIDQNELGIGIEKTDGVKIFSNGLFANRLGIALGGSEASNSNTLQLNRVEAGGIGLYLGLSTGNAISSNDLLTNASHGAVFLATSVKNKLYRNRAQDNGGLGYLDSTPGTGTARTANTYTSNICTGNNGGGAQSSPAGLCQ